MEQEIIYKNCQEIISDVPTIILGSGASIPYELPSMGSLALYLKDNINPDVDDKESWQQIIDELDKKWDLEYALQQVELSKKLFDQIVNLTWKNISDEDNRLYKQVICEGREISLLRLLKYCLKASNPEIHIITTNYDRIAEYAASQSKASYYTGFSSNHINSFDPNDSEGDLKIKYPGLNGQIYIWKVHGSLDWFKKENEFFSIKNIQEIPQDFAPSIVTPGVSKFRETHNDPYRSIFRQSDQTISNSTSFLAIGYGFNDEHVQPRLLTQLKSESKPLLILTKVLTEKTVEILKSGEIKKFIAVEDDGKGGSNFYIDSYSNKHNIEKILLWDFDTFLTEIIGI